MSSEQFYQWVSDGVMGRRGTISLLVGVALGWTGATLVNDSADSGDGDGSPVDESDGSTTETATAEPTETDEPTATETAQPTETETATETQESTAEPTATATPTDGLAANLDISHRGFGDETSYQVLYSIINRNDVAVVVDFAATVTLRNGETLRQERTATIDPGQAANDEFVFEGYDSTPTGWGFRPTDVRRA
ncbi:hypothetical protein SAMN04487949_3787 [Halogranum gelatinilyticum]|uniref:Uncharacterized protein n=1 Tax=Halogranum gelatinilyticum TaxID=660521 RepID=A0A1H0A192_9EURY|nr:hypothetical protein [Halogranum gelatinilyticum]SDN27054.1 hypothetical protein SAMN04487949_3787 [Halogranum gelatinilyticum]